MQSDTNILNFTPGLKSKYSKFYDRNAISKNNEKEKRFGRKVANMQKCRYDFLDMKNCNSAA